MSQRGTIEVRGASTKSFDDAVRAAVERANKTLEHVNCVWVVEQKATVGRGRITEYRVLVRVAADAIVSIDESQNVVQFDRGAEVTFGYSSGEVIGRPVAVLIPERYRSRHEHDVRRFAQSGVDARMMGERDRIVGLRKDGTEFPAVASISKHREAGRWRYAVLLREIEE